MPVIDRISEFANDITEWRRDFHQLHTANTLSRDF